MNRDIEPEHQLFLETVADYAAAVAARKIPLQFALQSLEEMAFHVDYQARVSIEVKPGRGIVALDVVFQDSSPGVSIIERD